MRICCVSIKGTVTFGYLPTELVEIWASVLIQRKGRFTLAYGFSLSLWVTEYHGGRE